MPLSRVLISELYYEVFFFFSSRRRHTRLVSDWSSDVCSSDLILQRSERACLGNRVNIEGLADFLHCRDQIRGAQAIANAKACEAKDFGESTHEDRKSVV